MLPLTRHQILLYAGQFHRLNEIYTSRSASEVIRELVNRHLTAVEARLQERPSEPQEEVLQWLSPPSPSTPTTTPSSPNEPSK